MQNFNYYILLIMKKSWSYKGFNAPLVVGDKAIIKYTGEIVTIREIVKAAYYCYYYYNYKGEASDGYFVEDDLIKLKG